MKLIAALISLPPLALALSALDTPRAGFLQDILESKAADQKYCKPTGLIQDACCDFETVESVNNDVFNGVHELVETPFFRYYKVDLFRECPFWQEDGSCMNRACSVETTDEEHIPEAWRSTKLSEIKHSSVPISEGTGCEVHDNEFCVLEDELDSDGLFVDLTANPERFTGYAGDSSARVWKAIYEENCFTPVPFVDATRATSEGGSGFASLGGLHSGAWGESEKKLFGSLAGPRDAGDEVCLEKRVFYRVLSGLHASISIHICDDYLDQTTGKWSPNLQCFITRIAQHPERLQNVYFTYVVALRALSKAGPQLVQALETTANDGGAAGGAKAKLEALIQLAQGCPSTFDETSMFSGPSSEILKTEFKEHFRNVSRIMDCVGCDKCRLWGKLQVQGLGTALKLLFSAEASPSAPALLSRGELVAFVNVLHRLSESLAAIERFRTMWARREEIDGHPFVVEKWTPPPPAVTAASSSSAVLVATPAKSSVPVGGEVPRSSGTQARSSREPAGAGKEAGGGAGVLERLVRLCREGWRSCAELFVRTVGGGTGVWRVEL